MTSRITLFWFRQDLRLHDNPSLRHAARTSDMLFPVFIHDHKHDEDTAWGFRRMGDHRRTFLRGALDGLNQSLQTLGSSLYECNGDATTVLIDLCNQLEVDRIVCEEIAAPEEQDEILALEQAGIRVETFWQSTMLSRDTLPWCPETVPDVFTAFRQGVEKKGRRFDQCEPDLSSLPALPEWSASSGHLAPRPQREAGMVKNQRALDWHQTSFPYPLAGFSGSETDALSYLASYFESDRPARYKSTRNGLSGVAYSTKFSPWLALGALSPRRIMQQLSEYESRQGQNDGSYWIWFELLWRDHFRWLHHKHGRNLYHKHGLRARDSSIGNTTPYNRTTTPSGQDRALERWTTGSTGHPFVDAGMRELSTTGYLSNRMRQIVASYLIHDLGVDWRAGAAWFESQLIDYDTYSNQGNWAYITGVGTDPRGGRRFNPDKQATEHDPDGAYQQRWRAR